MFGKPTLIATFLVLGLGAAHAQEKSPFSVGFGAGTLGVSGEIGYRMQEVGVRAGFSTFTYSRFETRNSVNFDQSIKLLSYNVLADWYPMGNGFRVTGGALINKNAIEMKGTTGSATIGSTTYSAGDVASLRGDITHNLIDPYLGVGYVQSLGGGLELSLDVGAAYQGSSKVTLSSTTNAISQSDLNAQADKIKNSADSMPFYPVLNLKINYRF
jgi:hypothetical protein